MYVWPPPGEFLYQRGWSYEHLTKRCYWNQPEGCHTCKCDFSLSVVQRLTPPPFFFPQFPASKCVRKRGESEPAAVFFKRYQPRKRKKKILRPPIALVFFFHVGGKKPYFSRSFASVGRRTISFGREVLWGVPNRTFAPYVISITGAWAGRKNSIFFFRSQRVI